MNFNIICSIYNNIKQIKYIMKVKGYININNQDTLVNTIDVNENMSLVCALERMKDDIRYYRHKKVYLDLINHASNNYGDMHIITYDNNDTVLNIEHL